MRKKIIAVCGNAYCPEDTLNYDLAFQAGKAIIDHGYRLQCGGLGGAMRAACKGARSSKNYREGDIIGIIPSFDPSTANEFVDIAIPTGLDVYRNVIVASADAVIVVGGGSGTLAESATAWLLKRLMVAFSNAEGWSARLAGNDIDTRKRYPDIPEDTVYPCTTGEEALQIIDKYIDRYVTYHEGIPPVL